MKWVRSVHEFTTSRLWSSGVVDRRTNVHVESEKMALVGASVTTVCAAVHEEGQPRC